MFRHALAGKFPHVWDRPQVLFSGHGTEATDTDVKAREKSALNSFTTCQLCSVGGSRIVLFSLFSLNLVHSVLCNAAVSNHRNCLNVALFLDAFNFGCVFEANGHFQRNYHGSCTTTRLLLKVSGLKFFNSTRSWTKCYLLHYLYLLDVK